MATKPKFAIAVSHAGRPLPCDWHLAMKHLMFPTNATHIDMWRKGMMLDDAMNSMTEDAISKGCEFIWYVDDDTQPPPDTIIKLLSALEQNQDAMACGGIYTTKRNPPEPLVYKERGAGAYWNWKMGDVFPCWAVGNGCLMVRAEVFRHMPKPWWKWINTIDELMQFTDIFPDAEKHRPASVSISPDIFFFSRLEQLGFKALAHGGVLPIHHAPDGKAYWLPKGSYPTQGVIINGEEYGWTDPDQQPDVDIKKALSIQGWMTPPELRWLGREAKKHKAIVEVGSYLGRSTMAIACNTSGTVYCVDDWNGPRDIAIDEAERKNILIKFLHNMGSMVSDEKVVFYPGDTSIEYPYLPATPDMVFVDGDHQYESVRRDLEWSRKIMPKGLLCGHDLDLDGVKDALIASKINYSAVPGTSIWYANL